MHLGGENVGSGGRAGGVSLETGEQIGVERADLREAGDGARMD